MKTTFTLFLLCLCSIVTAQTSVGTAVGFSPRNNGAVVQSVYGQIDLLQPQETILHFGAGAQYSIEYTQARHAAPYLYASLEGRSIFFGIRAGASYTSHIDERLKQNVGKSKWFGYTALHIDWINDRKVGGFMTINYSPKNSLDAVMGIRYHF